MMIFSQLVFAQACPSGDDPAISQKISEKLNVILCGFEDHDFPEEAGQRAFSDFKIFSVSGGKPVQIYASEEGETQLVTANPKGLTLVEVWEVGDKSIPALSRELVCEGEVCKFQEAKCVLKAPKNPFPQALGELEAMIKKGKVKTEAEDLVDKVFAQALGGDKSAGKFFAAARKPKGFEGANAEAWIEARKRTELAKKSKCL